jgi:hypothetical protein
MQAPPLITNNIQGQRPAGVLLQSVYIVIIFKRLRDPLQHHITLTLTWFIRIQPERLAYMRTI